MIQTAYQLFRLIKSISYIELQYLWNANAADCLQNMQIFLECRKMKKGTGVVGMMQAHKNIY